MVNLFFLQGFSMPMSRFYAMVFALGLLVFSCFPAFLIGTALIEPLRPFTQIFPLLIQPRLISLCMGMMAGFISYLLSLLVVPSALVSDLRWCLINILGMTINSVLYFILAGTMPVPESTSDLLSAGLLMACAFAITGVPLGFLQWYHLRKMNVITYWWIISISSWWSLGGSGYLVFIWVITNDAPIR
jgi:hypothetical protein